MHCARWVSGGGNLLMIQATKIYYLSHRSHYQISNCCCVFDRAKTKSDALIKFSGRKNLKKIITDKGIKYVFFKRIFVFFKKTSFCLSLISKKKWIWKEFFVCKSAAKFLSKNSKHSCHWLLISEFDQCRHLQTIFFSSRTPVAKALKVLIMSHYPIFHFFHILQILNLFNQYTYPWL